MKKEGKIIVFSAPSGGGKSTIISKVMEKYSNFTFSISATTRKPRGLEKNGIEYFFLSEAEFLAKVAKDEFLEHKEVFGKHYGTLKSVVNQSLAEGKNVILDIDVKGAFTVKEKRKDAILIFIYPPSLEVLEERLRARNTDSDEEIAKRLKHAKWEIEQKNKYDYAIKNEILEKSVEELLNIFKNNSILLD